MVLQTWWHIVCVKRGKWYRGANWNWLFILFTKKGCGQDGNKKATFGAPPPMSFINASNSSSSSAPPAFSFHTWPGLSKKVVSLNVYNDFQCCEWRPKLGLGLGWLGLLITLAFFGHVTDDQWPMMFLTTPSVLAVSGHVTNSTTGAADGAACHVHMVWALPSEHNNIDWVGFDLISFPSELIDCVGFDLDSFLVKLYPESSSRLMSTTTTVEALEVHLPEDADSILSMKSSKPAPTWECRSELEDRAGEKLSRPPFWARLDLPPADCHITL